MSSGQNRRLEEPIGDGHGNSAHTTGAIGFVQVQSSSLNLSIKVMSQEHRNVSNTAQYCCKHDNVDIIS